MTTSSMPLSALGAGFSNEALGSQAVFRTVLQALSHPGRAVAVEHDAQTPPAGCSAAAAVLLALLDSECSIWLSPALSSGGAGQWLRFHTGCVLSDDPIKARFAWVAQGDELPALSSLAQGSDVHPEQSVTCVVDVGALRKPGAAEQPAWVLQGPGIQGVATLQVQGVPADFVAQWADNHARFPRGVDVLLCTASHVVGLPRTTQLSLNLSPIPLAVEA